MFDVCQILVRTKVHECVHDKSGSQCAGYAHCCSAHNEIIIVHPSHFVGNIKAWNYSIKVPLKGLRPQLRMRIESGATGVEGGSRRGEAARGAPHLSFLHNRVANAVVGRDANACLRECRPRHQKLLRLRLCCDVPHMASRSVFLIETS